MIKVKNNTATREPLPSFLAGLAAESLADLSWTDPALGVRGVAWWPEEYIAPSFDANTHKLGAEILTLDAARKCVLVTHEVVPLTLAELDEIRRARTPQVVTMRQARLALLDAGLLDDVEVVIAGAGPAAKIEWDHAHEVHRDNPLIAFVQAQQGMTEAQIDALFERAATL